MSWEADFTPTFRTDLVGIDYETHESVMDPIVEWSLLGPPRVGVRNVNGMVFYETTVAVRYCLAYVIDDDRQRFAVLWLREKPIGVL